MLNAVQPPKIIGVYVILGQGHVIQVILPEEKAKHLIDNWEAEKLPKIHRSDSVGYGPWEAIVWSVKTEEIRAIHTFNPQTMLQKMQQQPQVGSPFSWGSGRN